MGETRAQLSKFRSRPRIAPGRKECDAHHRRRCYRGDTPDPVHRLKRQFLETEGDLLAGVDLPENRCHRDRLAESDVNIAVAPSQGADRADEPTEALLFLSTPLCLAGVVGDVVDLVVDNRDGDELDVFRLATPQ